MPKFYVNWYDIDKAWYQDENQWLSLTWNKIHLPFLLKQSSSNSLIKSKNQTLQKCPLGKASRCISYATSDVRMFKMLELFFSVARVIGELFQLKHMIRKHVIVT